MIGVASNEFILLVVFTMLFVYFGIMSVLSIFETVSTPLNMDEYDWNAQKAGSATVITT